MQNRIPSGLFALALLTATVVAQQPDPEAVKLKERRRIALIARITADSEHLRLPENKAILSARLGALAWKNDPEHARKLFQAAVSDLNAAQQEAESARNKQHLYSDLLQSQNTRPQILGAIALADPQFALESLYRTRPTAVTRAVAGEASEKFDGQVRNRLAESEFNLEQRLLRLAAAKSPDKAAAMLKDVIRKRLSSETFSSLQQLFSIDAGAAAELADDVLARLTAVELSKEGQLSWEMINLSNSFIADHLRERRPEEKHLAFNDGRIRTLALKLIGTYLEAAPRSGYVPFAQLEPIANRYSPQSIEKLRKAANASGRNSHWSSNSTGLNPEYDGFLKSNPTAEQIVQNAGRFSPELQRQMFTNAANKYSETGQYQAAVALLTDKFDGEALEHAVSSLNWYYAHHLMQKGDYDAAEAVMLEFNESNRISGLTTLAQTVFNRNPPENKNRAAGILRRVRSFMPERPENQTEVQQLFALISAMTPIEPNDAFANLEPLIEQINTLVQAFAVVQSYNGGQMRQGEYQIANGYNLGIHVDQGMFRNLANSDFDRTNSIIDSFTRTELRIALRMYLAENL